MKIINYKINIYREESQKKVRNYNEARNRSAVNVKNKKNIKIILDFILKILSS